MTAGQGFMTMLRFTFGVGALVSLLFGSWAAGATLAGLALVTSWLDGSFGREVSGDQTFLGLTDNALGWVPLTLLVPIGLGVGLIAKADETAWGQIALVCAGVILLVGALLEFYFYRVEREKARFGALVATCATGATIAVAILL